MNYRCTQCLLESKKWSALCSKCGGLVEENFQIKKEKNKVKNLSVLEELNQVRLKSSYNEINRVFGDGIMEGSVNLISGPPGIGKSTLLLFLADDFSKEKKVLYVSGEESEQQVLSRYNRLGLKNSVFFLYETSLEYIKESIIKNNIDILILDSIQTTVSKDSNSLYGSPAQLKEVIFQLTEFLKKENVSAFLIGHITKDGTVAGPKIVEHMVDGVFYFEGDKESNLRILKSYKNRFGHLDDLGIFEMTEKGLQEVSKETLLFTEDKPLTFGHATTCLIEGQRVFLTEIQSLVVENKYTPGKRISHGLDQNRLSLLIAVLEKYFKIPLMFQDIYINVVGGIKLHSRESDLAVIMSILSSYYQKILPKRIIYLGEVGLTGDLLPVKNITPRVRELDLLKFKEMIFSYGPYKNLESQDLQLTMIKKIHEIKDFFVK